MPKIISTVHKSVLLKESIEGLNLQNGDVVIDGTFGGGGHSLYICQKFPDVKIIALDQDHGAWDRAKSKFVNLKHNVIFYNENFRNLSLVLKKESIENVDAVLLDLGLSSDQFENVGRGFSFQKNEPLLMTIKQDPEDYDLTAEEIVNTWSEQSLADIIYGYGEEKFSRKIAKAIVETRAKKEIKTTFELVKILEDCLPGFYKRGRLHFATRTFQALRIAVNDELNTLEVGLRSGMDVLKNGGRLAVISFHSLEDRIVKNFFKKVASSGEGKLINKKPIIAGVDELKDNPRARSAKLRIIEKIKD